VAPSLQPGEVGSFLVQGVWFSSHLPLEGTGRDEIMHMFGASGVYIQMSPWPLHFMMMGRHGCAAALKITLSRG
jgi:hypothetical protein